MGLDKLKLIDARATVIKAWWLPFSMLLLALVLAFGGEATRVALRFDRPGILEGDWWRLISGHFVHLGGAHFALNAAGLGLVWYLVGKSFNGSRWLLIVIACLLGMDLGFWFLKPEISWYVGLSGLLHGLLAAGLAEKLRQPETETFILAALLLGKLAFEQLSGPLPGSEGTAGGPVVVDAHLFGAVSGALAAILLRIRVQPGAPI
ncbi:MAG: rhombosortase [Woeseiaceae bacterium]|jgi:rhomboid family GlyGly-CTERM serine protease